MDIKKEKRALQYLRSFEPQEEPYFLCYSGGKDSDCIRILASLAGVKHDVVHNLTTVDAPETVRYVKSIPGVIINYPRVTMWQLIVKNKVPPLRFWRYCCKELKEHGGRGRLKITGVRWAESQSRKENGDVIKIIGKPAAIKKEAEKRGVDYIQSRKGGIVMNNDNSETRRFVEHCYRTTSTMINPIIDWTDRDVWDFLQHYGCASNPLYQCGERRIGCIGCPMQGPHGMQEDFAKYPKYRAAYVRAFERMLQARTEAGLQNDSWTDGESVMRWWIGEDPRMRYQINFLDLIEETREV